MRFPSLLPCFLAAILFLLPFATANAEVEVLFKTSKDADSINLSAGSQTAVLVVDDADYPVVQLAAGFFADDVERVTGHRLIVTNAPSDRGPLIIVGTLGKSALLQQLIAEGRLSDVEKIHGRWEATLTQIVKSPLPGVERALVIAGSDRRGAAYGLMQLSQKIGVSPWYWWADVPAQRQSALAVKVAASTLDAPGVKYRGIFINDEDWGLYPWATHTFDPEFKNIGPKTYEKVFELMLRLRLNYLWPAMHEVSREFGSEPENYRLAGKYGIVAGSSHCEPMLFNNAKWDEQQNGRWNYSLNRDVIHSVWEECAKARGAEEAVWTLGIRGIHDRGMQSPPNDMPGKIQLMEEVFRDQRALLERHVSKEWGNVAQCFVPYKEVLPIYDSNLKVPDDITLVWVDDNFGYIRRLSSPAERTRSGGAGVYWHLSYYGGPHSYLWINSTAPALMWEEFHKAWENEARTIWVLNVGDIKPMEIGIDYFARLAWAPESFPLAAQRSFLKQFVSENFGKKHAARVASLLTDFYRLGTIRKPELMERRWAMSLTDERAKQLGADYEKLLADERSLARAIPAEARDAYVEMIGFPARILGLSGKIFLADREIQEGRNVSENQKQIERLRFEIDALVENFNSTIAGGKWNRMMPGAVTARNLTAWNSQVRWPWGEGTNRPAYQKTSIPERGWRNAASTDRQTETSAARWCPIEGLGPSGNAMALLPVKADLSWSETDSGAPTLEYRFRSKAGDAEAWIDFLPTFRIYPGMKLRVAVVVDDGEPIIVEVPGSSGAENENGRIRSQGVQDNFVRAHIPLPSLKAGKHAFRVRALDPGVVIDRIHLPEN